MTARVLALFALLGEIGRRAEAARELVRELGGEELLILIRDEEVNALLPAPGFPRTLPGGDAWRDFVAACTGGTVHRAELPYGAHAEPVPVVGVVASDASLMLVVGGTPALQDFVPLRPLLPLLAATFRGERAVEAAAAQTRLARDAALQAEALARSLDQARQRLEAMAAENARVYEAERAARQEAEGAIRARDEFLAIAAHELRNPLAGLRLTVQALMRATGRGPVDGARLERYSRIIDGTTSRLVLLVDDLLDVSRLRGGQMRLRTRSMDLAGLVREAVERSSRGLAGHHTIVMEGVDAEVPVQADPDRLDQVLANLLGNALKYSPEGGEIRVTLTPAESGILLRVGDQGIGLPDGAAEAIFQPFGRAPNAAAQNIPGMGLGLYVSRQIVQAHGGRLGAESAGEGRGTTLVLWLPRGVPNGQDAAGE